MTRRYHRLLVAALEPPLGRTLLVAKVDETLAYDGATLALATNRWAGGAVDPLGYRAIEHFALDGTTRVWTYAVADALVEKRVWPNRFPETGAVIEYNTVDATLWYFEAIRAYHAATDDDGLLKNLYPALEEIVRFHRTGTRHGIREDSGDGLLTSGEPAVQLTWIDAKVDDWVELAGA